MTYYSISALDLRSGKRSCFGGSEELALVDRFFAEDWPREERLGFTSPAVHVCYDSFPHAVRCIEKGQTIEHARLELLARGY